MSTIEITKIENVRRYTTHTIERDSLTPDQLIYIDCGDDAFEPVDDDGDTVIESILSNEAKGSSVRYGDADDLALSYMIDEIDG